MAVHTQGCEKKNGRDTALGCPSAWTSLNQEACGVTDLLGVTTVEKDAGPTTFTEEAGDFTAQPLHPRPFRVDVTALDADAVGVVVDLYYKDFWNNSPGAPWPVVETHTFTAVDTWDSKGSGRTLVAARFTVLGPPGATADVSIGFGFGTGTQVRIADTTIEVADNKDILAVRDPTSAALLTIVTVYANPYNTIIFDTPEATPADVTMEIQSHFDQINTGN